MPDRTPEADEMLKRIVKKFEDPDFWEDFQKTMEKADKLAKELSDRAHLPQEKPSSYLFPKTKFRQARLCRA
jgi:hypothetical protein